MLDLDIVLPVYNEKYSIESILKEWKKELELNSISFRFIICEDGSTDGTKELLIKIKKKYNIILNQKKERRGYALAVINGIQATRSAYVLCIDSDGQCDPKNFKSFWQNRNLADVVIGWRKTRVDPLHRLIFSFLFKLLFSLLFTTKIKDPSCPFVLFKKSKTEYFLQDLIGLKEGFWWGFSAMCLKKNVNILQLPINHRKRLKGTSSVFSLNKIFDIAIRNIIALILLKIKM